MCYVLLARQAMQANYFTCIPVIDSDSQFSRNWDLFSIVLLLFTALFTPFEVWYLWGGVL